MDLKTSELRENFPTTVLKIPHLIHIKGGDDAAQHEALGQREHAQKDEIVWSLPPILKKKKFKRRNSLHIEYRM